MRTLVVLFTTALSISSWAFAAEPSPAGIDFFEKNIRPVLSDRCYQCHSAKAEKLKGGLLLDSRQGVLQGGKDGPILSLGDPFRSKIIEAIRYTNPDLKMPPKEPLSAEQVKAFEEWIKMGAPDPRNAPLVVSAEPKVDYSKERKFWSFQPVKDVPVPAVVSAEGLISPIDYFLQANYESHQLRPMKPAQKRVLIRRATYDLTGLPPTPEEVQAFLGDDAANAFEKVVDRLLASPHYGEQWGRHWLDIVRYADTSGCNSDFPIPQMYKYRNYVIDSFNNDKGYDQFLKEQIAGDLLPHKDDAQRAEQTIATGYLAISRRFGSQGNEFYLTIQDTLDNLGKGMLGLSIGCARCHDHKFDPIPTRDYYSLYGIFASTKFSFPGTEVKQHPKDIIPLGTPEQNEKFEVYQARMGVLDVAIRELGQDKLHLQARLKTLKNPTTEPTENGRTMAQVDAELAKDKAEQRQMDIDGPPNVPTAFAVAEGVPLDARIQHKGLYNDLGETVPRGFLGVLGGQALPADEKGSGRLELADWIADPSNPLTARVMVNRIWEYHFGKGIVATPNDFGHRGLAPFDPALLDYLATRFMKSGWSVKAMNRLIMLSRAYQMSDDTSTNDTANDPENVYLWHFNPRRLSAEEIRDSILMASDNLDPVVDAGPHPFPPQSQWKYSQHKPYVADFPTNRRSVYMFQQRIRKQPFLAVFDGADTNDTTPDRPLSTTAIQALFMMNDPFMHSQADKLATRIETAQPDVVRRIRYAYEILYSRQAAPDEIELAERYLDSTTEKLKAANVPGDQLSHHAMASYMRVLLSGNEFIWLD